MRLAANAHIEWVDDEAVVLNQETGQLHYLNSSAAVILAVVIEYDDQALDKLIELYGDNPEMREEYGKVLGDLVEKNLLDG